MDKILAMVPMRSGSKSIPGKNIKPIAGKPLCAWVLEAAKEANIFKDIYVSTESTKIADIVQSLDLGIKIIRRPIELATDEASTESVMLHFTKKVEFDLLATIQVTSPLVKPEDFINAINKLQKENLDSLLTGVRVRRFLWAEEGTPINYDPIKRPLRQQFAGSIMENGAFYLTRRNIILESKSRLGGKIGIYEMAAETLVELDEYDDWAIVEELLRKRSRSETLYKLKNVKLLAMDCDGVLTDAGMYYSEFGEVLKKFNTRDAKGLELIRRKGIKTAIITGEESHIVCCRSDKMKVDDTFIAIKNKELVLQELMTKYKLKPENIAYVGDDIGDLTAMELAGFSFAVNDAEEEIKRKADYILDARGGKGAVRELCGLIIEQLKSLNY